MNWTDQQKAIFVHGEQNKGSLNVIARAGTGKTTTLVELANRVKGRVFLGAFNKAIADELATRVTANPRCTASTFHSIGFKLFREIRSKARVDNYKVSTLARNLYPYDKKVRDVIKDGVGFAKLDGLGLVGQPAYTDQDAWTEIFDMHDLWDDVPAGISSERVIGDCVKVFGKSLEMAGNSMDTVIDFDDMLYCPLHFGMWKPQRFDWVMMDEAQDTNFTRLELAASILVNQGSFVAVGDPCQAIYQFAGAAIGAMDKIKAKMGSAELPLSITYRCPKLVVEMAQSHVPDYVAAEGNQDGKITDYGHTELWSKVMPKLTPRDAVLCRNTRPLVGIARRFRREGVPCIVEGNNGKAVLALLGKWGHDLTWGQFVERLNQYIEAEVYKLEMSGKVEKAEYVREKSATLLDIADDPTPDTLLSNVVNRVERMFGKGQEQADVLRLCTVHRSKGREWDRVVLVGKNRYMPSPFAKTEADLEAEANIEYVAITRTKQQLDLVNVPGVKEEKEAGIPWWEM